MSRIIFKSSNNEFFVEINDTIFINIENECLKAKNNETGGILIGNYSKNRNAFINNVTGPPKDSKHSRRTFKRGISGVIDLLNNKWDLGQYYVGEWHFHSNSSSKPSFIDDKQMKKLARDKLLNCPEPILLVIGGNKDKWEFSVHVYTKDRKVDLFKE